MRQSLKQIELHPVDHCTLRCEGCQHGSPFLPRRVYTPEEYLPHLETLATFADWPVASYSGGEPFLHPNLADFIRQSFLGREVWIFTNGFWLTQTAWLETASEVLPLCTMLNVSRYPVYVERIGRDEWHRRLDMLRKRFATRIEAYHPNDPADLVFEHHGYHGTRREIEVP